MSAEHVISRKHTSKIDLLASIDDALNAFMASIQGFNELFQRLNARTLTRTKAHSLIVEAARAGAFASDSILPIVTEFENPQHEAFNVFPIQLPRVISCAVSKRSMLPNSWMPSIRFARKSG